MCGIAGIYQGDRPDDELGALLGRMSGTLVHRGPDDHHQVLMPAMRSGLAVRRLSLVDVAGGRQPLENEDGTIVLACNGEIYNHRALRAELLGKGHHFRTGSDCEVIVHLYEEVGLDCLKRLDGMFALALLDGRARRLVLARDPAGMKPLYFSMLAPGIVFASEARALLAAGTRPAPDWDAIDTYLAYGYVPAPKSCFAGLERLRAGSYLVAEDGQVHRGAFWRCEYRPPPPTRHHAEELEQRLRAAVATHLAADVPVGAFLSGGWDSSLVTVFAAAGSAVPLKTFSIALPETPAYDETRWARQVATALGSEHFEVEFRNSDLPQLLPRVVRAIEEPCVTSPAPLLYALSARASTEVKAVLSGEGSDELFGGYPWLRGDWVYALRQLVPRFLARHLAGRSRRERWRRLWRLTAAPSDEAADREWLRVLTSGEIRRLLAARPDGEVAEVGLFALDPETRASCRDALQRRLGLEFTHRLADAHLFVADKASMAHSLEVRMPFLDRHVVDFALALPSHWKIRHGQEKYVLKHLTRHLPPAVAARRKHGLVVPIRAAEKREREWARAVLLDGARRSSLFDRTVLERWLDEVLSRRREGMPLVWTLLNLQMWWECFLST
jgi:asparagine synthase (glutamine-hydrolysing)